MARRRRHKTRLSELDGRAKIGINSTFAKKLDAAGWGIFFLWVGAVMLTDVGWTWSILGVGVIVMGVQLTLLARGHKADIFMLVLGAMLIFSAVPGAASLDWSVFPLGLMLLGGAILMSVFAHRRY